LIIEQPQMLAILMTVGMAFRDHSL